MARREGFDKFGEYEEFQCQGEGGGTGGQYLSFHQGSLDVIIERR